MERRAIDEVRRIQPDELAELPEGSTLADGAVEPDFAGHLDDLDRIRRWRSGIRLRLSRRERQAAVLHFIQGYSRVETAEMLGVPPRRADKIFDSITTKTSGLLAAIDDGSWCDSERSLMAAFSAGVLDPSGERHAIALQHVSECPGCAALVRRLRVAYVVVPAPALAGVATAAGGGALGAALGLAEVTSTGAGAGVTAGGAGIFGGLTAKTAVMCASAVCLTGAGASVAVVESVRHPSRPEPARAAGAPKTVGRSAPPNMAISSRPVAAALPQPTPATNHVDPPKLSGPTRPAPKQRAAPDPQAKEQARRAAVERQQENELGIEPDGSTPSTEPSTSSASQAPSDGLTSASSASTGGTAGGGAVSAAPQTSEPSGTRASGGGSSGGGSRGATEIGIEP